jgi:hypothetical protein
VSKALQTPLGTWNLPCHSVPVMYWGWRQIV